MPQQGDFKKSPYMKEGDFTAKRYYWLKLPDGFFRQKSIKKLRKIAGGDTYTIIYLKMLLVAMKQDSRLYFEGVEATFYDELALDLDEDVENVKVTVMFLLQQGLMQLIDETEYTLTECAKLTGSESASAERMRKLRDKKASQCYIDVTQQLRLSDVEKEIEKEIEKDKNINIFAQSSEKQTSELEANIAALILNDGSEWRPSKALFAEYVRLYPGVDVEQQFNEMRGWCLSNPQKRKTRKGITRFVNSWLAREQDKGVGRSQKSERSYAAYQANRFNNFQQRDVDYDALLNAKLNAAKGQESS